MRNRFLIPEGAIVLFELHGVGSVDTIKKIQAHKIGRAHV